MARQVHGLPWRSEALRDQGCHQAPTASTDTLTGG